MRISLLALAKAATAFNLVRPTMAENPILNIHKGRNLLQEICVTAFVANDTKIEGGPDGERYHSMVSLPRIVIHRQAYIRR